MYLSKYSSEIENEVFKCMYIYLNASIYMYVFYSYLSIRMYFYLNQVHACNQCIIKYILYDVSKYLWTAAYIQQPRILPFSYRFTFLLITRLKLKCQRSNSPRAHPDYLVLFVPATRVISQNERDYVECIFPSGRRQWTDARHSYAYKRSGGEGAMTVKGGYYFSLPWLREAFETLDDLATLPAVYYTYVHTRTHTYTRVHTCTIESIRLRRKRERESGGGRGKGRPVPF